MNPWGDFGGPNKLIEAYVEWRDQRLALNEADMRADFPSFLFGPVRTALWQGYNRVAPNYRRYVRVENSPDFRARRLKGINGLRGIGYVGEHGHYPVMRRTERPTATLVIDTYGGIYAITRHAIINDESGDLLNRNPADMGFEAGRFVAETVIALIESNPTAPDGAPFYSSGRGNQTTSPLSETSLAAGVSAMESQLDDDGNHIVVRPNSLVVKSATMELVARRIINSQLTGATAPSTATDVFDKGTMNPIAGIIPADGVVRDPFFTDNNDWYLIADPNDVAAFAVGFLNGNEAPFIGLKNPEVRNALGAGQDPYTYELDSVDFKVRQDFGVASVDPKGVYRGIVP
jgi:hypothetical protein